MAWTRPLEKVFPSVSGQEQPAVDTPVYSTDKIYVCRHKAVSYTHLDVYKRQGLRGLCQVPL